MIIKIINQIGFLTKYKKNVYSHVFLEGFVSAIILMRVIFHGATLIIDMLVSCKLMWWPVGGTKGYNLFYRSIETSRRFM